MAGKRAGGCSSLFEEGSPEEITWAASEFDLTANSEVTSSIEQHLLNEGEPSVEVRQVKLLVAGTFGEDRPESGRYGLNYSVETPDAIRGTTDEGTASPVP